MEDKRQKDSKSTSLPRQDQPEAEISLVDTKEQDNPTTLYLIDKLANTASLKEKDNKILKDNTT